MDSTTRLIISNILFMVSVLNLNYHFINSTIFLIITILWLIYIIYSGINDHKKWKRYFG